MHKLRVKQDCFELERQICSSSYLLPELQEITMKLLSSISTLFFTLLLLPIIVADLNSDIQSLLQFSAAVPHLPKLNWNPSLPICTSWVGVTCNPNGTRVIALRLPAVGLFGSIPPNTLGNLDALQILSLRSNALSGPLPSDIPSLPSLQYLFLHSNNFSGTFPLSLSLHLNVLDLSSNSFSGIIPPSIQNLTKLTALYLQNNSFSGSLPNLNFHRLRILNLSFNDLNGSIPHSLQNLSYSSFLGNPQLCGFPLKRCSTVSSPPPAYLPTSPTKSHIASSAVKLSTNSIIAIAIAASAVLFLIVVAVIVCCLKKRVGGRNMALKRKGENEKSKSFGSGVQAGEKNKLFFFEGCSYSFNLEDLLRASAEVLGKGSYGTTYKAVMDDGTTVAVKRLREVMVGKKDFEQQMEIVGRLSQHPNVVPLRAFYFSKDEKLLVYNYFSAGSFAGLLHDNGGGRRTALDWDSRVKICLRAARGIAHIHSQGGGKFVHGNIKASNVLIDENLDGGISDAGLAPMINFPATTSRIVGYRAPEVIETRKVTQMSDVYSFGVLLLEMLTGKAPLQAPGHDTVVDLPRWVRSVVREEWTAEVFDAELTNQNVEEEMVQMLQLALACVTRVPDMRPQMDQVVRMMEELRQSDSTDRPSSDTP